MSIKYDIYETPSPDGEEGKKLHARVVNMGLYDTAHLAKDIEHATALTEGDVKAVLSAISYCIEKHLSQGERVHIDGLGYFQLVATSETVENAKEMRGEKVKFKTVNFLPEKKLKKKLSLLRFTKSPLTNHSRKYSLEKVEAILENYFQEHTYITRKEFQQLCNFTKSMALKRLTELVEQGTLKKGGIPRFPIYEPVRSRKDFFEETKE